MDHEDFERLKPEEQEKIFHKSPFGERGDLILHAHNPAGLTQSLSQEELYLVTREMDADERSEIIRYGNLPQLFFISDIDCWKKDRLDSKSFVRWLETLQLADEARLFAWLVEMDYETVVSGFRTLIEVVKPEYEYPSDEVLGDRPFFTLDERYFILVNGENIETVRRAIEILFENHHGRYTAIMEGLLGELDYELEEEAFQNRSRRLSERGFPDPETAHHVYRPISKEEFENYPRKSSTPQAVDLSGGEVKAPRYLVLHSKDRLFLDEALLLFREEPPEVREGLEEELAWISNKIIASQGVGLASEERVREGVERARRIASLGLEALSGGKLPQAREILKEKWLETIFRWGMSELTLLREEASQIVHTHWGDRGAFVAFLDSPYEFIFHGLFQPVPECHDPRVSESPQSLRDFKSMDDLEKTRRAVRQIEKIHGFLTREFPNIFSRLKAEFRHGAPEALLFAFLGTSFASFFVRGKLSTRPLSLGEFSRFLQTVFEGEAPRRLLKKECKETFLKQFHSEEEREILRPLWGLLFQRMEEELGGLSPRGEAELRYVSSVVRIQNEPSGVKHE